MTTPVITRSTIRQALALLALVNCLVVAVVFARYAHLTSSSWPAIFPFPGLYLIEIGATGALGLAAAVRPNPAANAALWALAGVLLAFVALGGFSLGLFLLPAFICLPLTALLASPGVAIHPLKGLAWMIGAAVTQGMWMVMFIQLSIRGVLP